MTGIYCPPLKRGLKGNSPAFHHMLHPILVISPNRRWALSFRLQCGSRGRPEKALSSRSEISVISGVLLRFFIAWIAASAVIILVVDYYPAKSGNVSWVCFVKSCLLEISSLFPTSAVVVYFGVLFCISFFSSSLWV